METHILGIPFHFISVCLQYTVQVMLVFSTVLKESLLMGTTAVPAQTDEEDATFSYDQIEWSKRMNVHPSSASCVDQHSHNLPNKTLGEYRMGLSIGDGLYIFGFICVLIVLKSLLTKIMMVETKPEDSAYVITMCESPPNTYKITLQRHKTNNSVPMTSSKELCLGQTQNTASTRPPMFYSGSQCFPLSNLDGADPYYGKRCPVSSLEGSANSLA
ncbi:uncharacterized protein LOC134987665 [Pseudophryne corroboree]|uniref:uncharacterized protein LOC134987665 n=1 Tax=Pseudophryne corroboree TaxID=495146 RepID=UPI00308197E4